jgi:hypothetical protein
MLCLHKIWHQPLVPLKGPAVDDVLGQVWQSLMAPHMLCLERTALIRFACGNQC